MTDSISGLALFKGTSPDECEAFVAAVRLRALEQGKHRDNEWMAVFASGHLREEALYWYEDLEESVQNDWSQLRPALLARFGSRRKNPTATSSVSVIPGSTSSTTIPTPAAAPPAILPPPLVRKGRLKVVNFNGTLQGYITTSDDGNGLYQSLSVYRSDALLVQFTPSVDGLFVLQINDASKSPHDTDALAITWAGLVGGVWINNSKYLATCCSLSTVTSHKSWAVEQKVWEISKDGELSVDYPKPEGGYEKLQPCVDGEYYTLAWARPSNPSEDHIRIIFEDAV